MDVYKVVSGEDKIFQEGVHFPMFGRSNVGKSSLINALLGTRVARTSNKPGKTITFNFYKWDEKSFLVDLPGYGFARGGAKQIEKLRRRLLWYLTESGAKIHKFILVLDAKAGLTEVDKSALILAKENNLDLIIVVNKADKLNQSQRHKVSKEVTEIVSEIIPEFELFMISAKTGRGVEDIKNFLSF